jgi:hypothetical protein
MHARFLALLLLVGLAAAGCGSGGKSPSVASLGGAATSTSQSATPPAGGLSTGGRGGSGSSFSMKIQGGLKYAKCMRAHGVHNFPDPGSGGGLTIDSSSGIDPNSPAFRSAQAACAKELPNGGRPTPQQIAAMKKGALRFSACMRAHGIKDFPDPDFTGQSIRIAIRGGAGSDLNPNNPTFQRAQAACQGFLGKGPPGGKK